MLLTTAIGIIAILMAVLGGIVSTQPPSDKRHRSRYIAAFIGCGVLAVILICAQAIITDRASSAAQQRQDTLIGKVESESKDLNQAKQDASDSKQILLQSQLSQARMEGELKALQIAAGNIGSNSSSQLKDLVGEDVPNVVGGRATA